jgi:hypothetical protein
MQNKESAHHHLVQPEPFDLSLVISASYLKIVTRDARLVFSLFWTALRTNL